MVKGLGLRSIAYWDCGFESRLGMDVGCECCALSGRGLCDELITRPGETYRLVRRCVCSRNLKNEEAMARVGPQRHRKERTLITLK